MAMTIEQQRALALAQARLRAQQQAQAGQANQNADLWQPGTPFTPSEGGANRADPMWWAGEVAGGVPGALNAFNEGFGEGIPVVGPLVTEGGLRAGAGLSSLFTGEPYDEALSGLRDFREDRMEGQDGARLAGNVAGAVAPLGLVGSTQAGAQALGLSGTLPQRVAFGGLSGGGIAAADTAARGGDMGDIAAMGALGLGAGAAFPLAERPAQAIARMLMGQRGASPAERAISNALQRDQIDPATLPQRLDAIGPEALPVDLGANLTRQGGAIAAMPGEGATTIRNVLTERAAQTNPRIQAQIRDILGEAPVPSALQSEIRAGQTALSPEYTAVLNGPNVRAIDTAPLADTLDAWAVSERGKGQQVAREIRSMLNIAGENVLDPNPATLLATRNAIDGMMSSETNTNAIRILTNARQEIDGMLSRSVPGLKDVDARFAELARQGEAVQTGQQLLDSGRTAVRPQELEAMMAQQGTIMGPTGVPFRLRQGAVAEIDRIVGTTANNLNALKTALKGDGSWNRDRLVTLFGQDKADALLNVLEREIAFNRSFNTITQNSETAARQAAMQDVSPRQFGERPTGIVDLLMRAPQAIANAGARTRSQAVNAQIAEMLTGRPSPELVDRLIAIRAGNRGTLPPASIAALLTNQGGAN